MESVVRDYISCEFVSRSEWLPLKNDTPLLASGILDSLALLNLMVFLEKEFNISVDEFELIPENFNTIQAICTYVRSRQQLQIEQ